MARTRIEPYLHIVFSTKHRANIVHPEIEAELHRSIAGIIAKLNSRCIAVNGTENHVHTLVSLGKTMATSNLVREGKEGIDVVAGSLPLTPPLPMRNGGCGRLPGLTTDRSPLELPGS